MCLQAHTCLVLFLVAFFPSPRFVLPLSARLLLTTMMLMMMMAVVADGTADVVVDGVDSVGGK